MWTDILGALAIVAIVYAGQFVIPAATQRISTTAAHQTPATKAAAAPAQRTAA